MFKINTLLVIGDIYKNTLYTISDLENKHSCILIMLKLYATLALTSVFYLYRKKQELNKKYFCEDLEFRAGFKENFLSFFTLSL